MNLRAGSLKTDFLLWIFTTVLASSSTRSEGSGKLIHISVVKNTTDSQTEAGADYKALKEKHSNIERDYTISRYQCYKFGPQAAGLEADHVTWI